MELFETKDIVQICAPMVRYSKQSFRHLVRRYNCDLCYTPMIVADSFIKSNKARDADFTTNGEDRPLIVQFAANNAKDFADAVELIQPYADGYGLNCGCPQRWAMAEGYGCHLIKKPDQLKDIILQTRQRIDKEFPCEIKIRIFDDMRKTVDMCQQIERAGASWLSVHGRTSKQRKEPVNYEAIKTIKQSLQIPVVANGDIKSETDIEKVKAMTGVDGVMVAQGLLTNPAMFSGFSMTPKECVKDWLDISLSYGISFTTFHHHLIYMMDKWHTKPERQIFNNLQSITSVLDYLDTNYDISINMT